MRIAVISLWFAERSTYVESSLPRALARLGHEVHLITSALQPNYDSPNYERDYAPALGAGVQPLGVRTVDGVVVHRLPHTIIAGSVSLSGLSRVLRELRPDIVQTAMIVSWPTFVCAAYRLPLGYKLFVGAHQAEELAFNRRGPAKKSIVMRATARLSRWIPGRMVSGQSAKCYAVTDDAAEVAIELYGYQPAKLTLLPLGFDEAWFHAPVNQKDTKVRQEERLRMGIRDEEIVCIYTGRLTAFKNPLLLASAVERLNAEGLNYRALFVGGGEEEQRLRARSGTIVESFVAPSDLARYYWASDIAVWPRSYSASQVEAVACGLPLIMSDASRKAELHDVSIRYKEDDLDSLTEILRGLGSRDRREALGRAGAELVRAKLSWSVIAAKRAQDYRAAIGLKHSDAATAVPSDAT
jgi:glycosyltransferase involved in cell wall biosynthesis